MANKDYIYKEDHPIVHKVLAAEDFVKEKSKEVAQAVSTTTNHAAKGFIDGANAAARGTKTVAVSAARKSGNTGLNVANSFINAKNSLRGTVDNARNKYNSMGNYTGKRSRYQFKNGSVVKSMEVTSNVTLGADHYIKVKMTDESKTALNDALEKHIPKTKASGNYSLWNKSGGSYKRKTYRGRKKNSYLKKGRRSRRKRL